MGNEMLILLLHERRPRFLSVSTKNTIVALIKRDPVLVDIGKEVVSTQHLCYFHKLVIVVLPVKERLLSKNHACKH